MARSATTGGVVAAAVSIGTRSILQMGHWPGRSET